MNDHRRRVEVLGFFRFVCGLVLTTGGVLLGAATGASGQMWSGWVREPASIETKGPVAATEFEGKVYVFSNGRDGSTADRRVYLQTFDQGLSAGSSIWQEVPGGGLTGASLAATAASGDRLYLFAKGLDGQPWINTKTWGGGPLDGWSGWTRGAIPAGSTNVALAAATTKNGTVYLFRTDPGGTVYMSRRIVSAWAPWVAVPGPATSLPLAAAYDEIRDKVFVFRVKRTLRTIYVNVLDGSAASPACRVNGDVLTAARATAAGDGDGLRLFHKGLDGRLYVQTLVDRHPYDGACGSFSLPMEVRGGGVTKAAPTATYFAYGSRLMLFVQGLDQGVYYNTNRVVPVHIQAVRFADSKLPDRRQCPNAAVTGIADVADWVNYANRAFAPAFLRLVFDPARDWTPAPVCDTDLNQKWPNLSKATKIADAYPGKIVIFFRARSEGNGYSWYDPGSMDNWDKVNFVMLPGDLHLRDTIVCGHPNLAQLAHDVGHYLGLRHTFPRKSNFASADEAKQWLKDGNSFDGDGFSDTPEDPGPPVASACGQFPSYITFEGKTYSDLPRTNVMSYYAETATTFFSGSPLIQAVTPQQIARMYEVLAARGFLPVAVVP